MSESNGSDMSAATIAIGIGAVGAVGAFLVNKFGGGSAASSESEVVRPAKGKKQKQKAQPAPSRENSGPNEKARERKARARARREAEAAAAIAAAEKAAEEKKIAQARLDKAMRAEADRVRKENEAVARKRREERKLAAEKFQAEREAAKKEAEAAAIRQKAEAAERKKQREENAQKQKDEAEANKKRKKEKEEKLKEEHAKRKQAMLEAKKMEAARIAAAKAEAEAEAAEAKRIRELQRQQDEATREKAANWEQAAEIAAKKQEEDKAKKLERKRAKIAKSKAKAEENHRIAVELAAASESGVDNSAAASKSADRGNTAKFTIERVIPDAPEEDDDVVERITSVESDFGDADADIRQMQVRLASLKTRTEKISGLVMTLTKDKNAATKKKAEAKAKAAEKQEKPTESKPDAAPVEAEAAAPEIDPLTPPSSVPVAKEEYTTYEDDAALGKPAPSLDSIEYIKGDPIAVGNGKVSVILFWAKFAKGDYTTVAGLSALANMYAAVPEVQFLGISVDPEKADAESFLKKIGTSMPEIYITDLQVPYPLAWDTGKSVKEAFRKLSGLMSLGVSAAFIVDGDGNVVWREQFGQGYFPPEKGQLAEQLRRTVRKESLISNGPKPQNNDDEEEETMDIPDDDDDDLGLGW